MWRIHIYICVYICVYIYIYISHFLDLFIQLQTLKLLLWLLWIMLLWVHIFYILWLWPILRPHGHSPWNSLVQNTGVGSLFPSPGDLLNPGIEPRSPTLQVDSLSAEPQGKPKNTGVCSLFLLQGIFQTQESNWVSCIAGRFFTSWAMREALSLWKMKDLIKKWCSPFLQSMR